MTTINLDKLYAWAFMAGGSSVPPSAPMLASEQKAEVAERYAGAVDKHGEPVKPPRVLPATEQLRSNLERAALAYANRERVLLDEIAAREAELADVRRARDAATAGLMEMQLVGEVSLDPVREATDRMQDAVEAARYPVGVDPHTFELIPGDIYNRLVPGHD